MRSKSNVFFKKMISFILNIGDDLCRLSTYKNVCSLFRIFDCKIRNKQMLVSSVKNNDTNLSFFSYENNHFRKFGMIFAEREREREREHKFFFEVYIQPRHCFYAMVRFFYSLSNFWHKMFCVFT